MQEAGATKEQVADALIKHEVGFLSFCSFIAEGREAINCQPRPATYTDSVMGSWTFAPDTLNRLSTATAGTGVPSGYANHYGCWTYDAFGNRTSESMSTTACTNGPTLTSWAHYAGTSNGTGNNQMSATSLNANQANGYDAAGNVTADGNNTYLYDAEGRICAVASSPLGQNTGLTIYTGYIYDAEGRRVAKGSITSLSCNPAVNGFQTTSDFVRDQNGEQVTEMGVDPVTGASLWAHSNVWAGGKLLATYDNDSLHFYFTDALVPWSARPFLYQF